MFPSRLAKITDPCEWLKKLGAKTYFEAFSHLSTRPILREDSWRILQWCPTDGLDLRHLWCSWNPRQPPRKTCDAFCLRPIQISAKMKILLFPASENQVFGRGTCSETTKNHCFHVQSFTVPLWMRAEMWEGTCAESRTALTSWWWLPWQWRHTVGIHGTGSGKYVPTKCGPVFIEKVWSFTTDVKTNNRNVETTICHLRMVPIEWASLFITSACGLCRCDTVCDVSCASPCPSSCSVFPFSVTISLCEQ